MRAALTILSLSSIACAGCSSTSDAPPASGDAATDSGGAAGSCSVWGGKFSATFADAVDSNVLVESLTIDEAVQTKKGAPGSVCGYYYTPYGVPHTELDATYVKPFPTRGFNVSINAHVTAGQTFDLGYPGTGTLLIYNQIVKLPSGALEQTQWAATSGKLVIESVNGTKVTASAKGIPFATTNIAKDTKGTFKADVSITVENVAGL